MPLWRLKELCPSQLKAEDPLAVRADVSVDNKVTIGGKVDIQGKVKPTLLPVPGL